MHTYVINVAKRNGDSNGPRGPHPTPYSHYFRVELGSDYTRAQAMERFERIREAFPLPAYNVDITEWTVPVGTRIAASGDTRISEAGSKP